MRLFLMYLVISLPQPTICNKKKANSASEVESNDELICVPRGHWTFNWSNGTWKRFNKIDKIERSGRVRTARGDSKKNDERIKTGNLHVIYCMRCCCRSLSMNIVKLMYQSTSFSAHLSSRLLSICHDGCARDDINSCIQFINLQYHSLRIRLMYEIGWRKWFLLYCKTTQCTHKLWIGTNFLYFSNDFIVCNRPTN